MCAQVGDPRSRRSVGTQSEVPHLSVSADRSVRVTGYQKYILNASGAVQQVYRSGKYDYLTRVLRRLHCEQGATTLADIGCSAGLMSLVARHQGYRRIYSLDHDSEYIGLLQRVVQVVRVPANSEIRPATFDFGEQVQTLSEADEP